MEYENRKYISIIYFLRKFIKVFFNLFFNIYILKIVNNDLNFIIKYTMFGIVLKVVYSFFILNFINSKNAKVFYRGSFLLLISVIALLLVFKENIVKYIYLFKTIEMLAETCYSYTHELIVIGSNNNKTMSNFMANITILTGVATVIAPILAGFIIQEFSYYVLFVLLILETLVIIDTSTKIKNFTINDKKIEMQKFLGHVKKHEYLKDSYKCMFFRRISSQGAILQLLPIILFLRLGKEFELGVYNSIFAIISIISLEVLKIINKKKIKKDFYVLLSVVIFISSVVLVYNSSFISLIIYYIFMNSFGSIIESESCTMIYAAIKPNRLVRYKKEHIVTYNLYMAIGEILSYILVYVLYNNFYNVDILSITVSILMFFLIISAIYLGKTEKALRNY